MASNLVLLDKRLTPEEKVAFFAIERRIRRVGSHSARLSWSVLASLLKLDPANIRKASYAFTKGNPDCKVPLIELTGHEKNVRTFVLLPIREAYDGPVEEEVAGATGLQNQHGRWVSSFYFTPLPDALLYGTESASLKVVAAILMGLAQTSSDGLATFNMTELGTLAGFKTRDRARRIVTELDGLHVGSVRAEGYTKIFQFQPYATWRLGADNADSAVPAPTREILDWGKLGVYKAQCASTAPSHTATRLGVDHAQSDVPTPIELGEHEAQPGDVAPNISREEAEETTHTHRQDILTVCGMHKSLCVFSPAALEGLMKQCPNLELLGNVLDIAGDLVTRGKKINDLMSFIIRGYQRGGLIPHAEFTPWTVRIQEKPIALDFEQEYFEFPSAPERFKKLYPLLGDETKKLLLTWKGSLTILETDNQGQSECLLIAEGGDNAIRFLSSEISRLQPEIGPWLGEVGFSQMRILSRLEARRLDLRTTRSVAPSPS